MSEAKRDLFAALKAAGLLEWGAVIPREFVHEALGLEFPRVGTKAEFDKLALAELSAIDYVREALLNQGKYIAGTPSGYRVLLPSENQDQINLYISAADRKLKRAMKLNRSTPALVGASPDQTEARILMKQAGMNPRRVAHHAYTEGRPQ
jgi:hypothetical protein